MHDRVSRGIIAALAILVTAIAVYPAIAAASNMANTSNSVNNTQQQLVPPKAQVSSGQINVYLNQTADVKTPEKTGIVGLSIVVVGAVGIAAGLNQTMKSSRKGRKARKESGDML